MTMRLELDFNEKAALMTALDNYLNGIDMEDGEEDESTLEAILVRLEYS
jgi:hypothetical protein